MSDSNTPVIKGQYSLRSQTRSQILPIASDNGTNEHDSPAYAICEPLSTLSSQLVINEICERMKSFDFKLFKSFKSTTDKKEEIDLSRPLIFDRASLQRFGMDVLRSSMGLLFSKRSLLVVHHLFVDNSKDKVEKVDMNANNVELKIIEAHDFIKKSLLSILANKYENGDEDEDVDEDEESDFDDGEIPINGLNICYNGRLNVQTHGYGCTKPYYDPIRARIHISMKLYDWHQNSSNTSPSIGKSYAIITQLHELIHVLSLARFEKSSQKKEFSTPEISKFEIETL